jgi:hypothetical protein
MSNIQISVAICKDKFQGNQKTFIPKSISRFSDMAEICTSYAWCPSIFRKNQRHTDNTIETNLVVLDYDVGIPTLQEMLIMLEVEGLRHIVALSRNHQKEKSGLTCDRFRVILHPKNKPSPNNEQFYYQIKEFHKRFPKADGSCCNTDRFYFPCSQIVVVSDGSQVEWPNARPINDIKKSKIKNIERRLVKANYGVLDPRTSAFLNRGIYRDSRRRETFLCARNLAIIGWDYEKTYGAVINAPYSKEGLKPKDLDDLPRQITNGYKAGRIYVERLDTGNTNNKEEKRQEGKATV